MMRIISLQERLSKLNDIKIDASTLASLRERLNDPLTYTKPLADLQDRLSTPRGTVGLSAMISLVGCILIIPLQYSEFNKNQQLYSQYLSEEAQLKDLRSRKRALTDRKQLLTKSDQITAAYLDNSDRLLLLPELIRTSSVSHNLRLISFSPSNDQNSSDMAPMQTNQAQQQQEGFATDGISGDSTNPSLATPPISTADYTVTIEGDYLRILTFLNEIQSFKSFIGFKSVRYNSTNTSTSAGLSSQVAGSNGIVESTIELRIPTRSASYNVSRDEASGD